MSKDTNQLLLLGGLGVGGFLLYEKFFKAAPLPVAPGPNYGNPYVTTSGPPNGGYDPMTGYPTYGQPIVSPPVYLGPQPSNLNPGAAVGGVVGTCMFRKNWPQAQCQQRLDALVDAYNKSKQNKVDNTASGDLVGAAGWDKAMTDHRSDYFALTGVMLG